MSTVKVEFVTIEVDLNQRTFELKRNEQRNTNIRCKGSKAVGLLMM